MNHITLRRRVAKNTNVNPYITDGLIAMFDAEWNVGLGKHEESPESWKDLTGHIILNAVPSTFGNNYVILDVTPSFESQAILDAINQDKLAVEMVIKPLRHGSISNNMYIHVGSTRGFWLWDNTNNVFSSVSYREIGAGYTSINLRWNAYGGYISKLSLNGNRVTIKSNATSSLLFDRTFTNTNTVTGEIKIGNATSNFELYCIRFYEKVLSQEEINHNALIDKERFGLNI